MQGPGASLLLSVGELGAAPRGSAAWFCREGGPVCSWRRKPQPTESRIGTSAPWPCAHHTEFQPPEKLLGPGPASARPEGARSGRKRGAGSPAAARGLSRAFELPAYGIHAQSTEDLCRFRSPHTSALDDAQSQEDEACCGLPILVGGGGEDETTWGGGTEGSGEVRSVGIRMKGGERSVGVGRPGETLGRAPRLPHAHSASFCRFPCPLARILQGVSPHGPAQKRQDPRGESCQGRRGLGGV